jgi:hypothetical protein
VEAHLRTRLQDELIDAEILVDEVYEIQAQRLLARIDRPSGKKKRTYWR